MTQKRLRKIAKNIVGQPKLKKDIAAFLAKNIHNDNKRLSTEQIQSMLINGNRGFLAMNEKELTDKFDAY